ncbi:MAG: glycosyltransferase family 39 protein [Proteobacteria bacterium]|nr:glycosyltransferase family 39 protein [Pseudomonadota bacterium]HQR03266.1 phospholipid carrier-dependent glycosyltransferase [Rhodocyclaceae bacterium]
MSSSRLLPRVFLPLALIALAALVLGLGITEPTGLTGKDEYLLGLRIPLEMMQGDHWWVPFIDGLPRLKKPPFLYWLGRASYEMFGPSLLAARGITVAFALLLLGGTTWIGKFLGGHWRTGLIAAAVLLGMSGIASESRRLMLDVPVAALSLGAFCCYLGWLRQPRWSALLACAATLSAAILTKGPLALIVCGGGMLALWIVRPALRDTALRHWPHHLLALLLAAALPVFWFLYVRDHFGAELARITQDELEARQLSRFSLDPAIGILTLALPWSFVAFQSLWVRRHDPDIRFLACWLALTLLPFFFIRTFERYLIGSLPALAILAAFALERGNPPCWTRRLGSVIPALLALILIVLLWRWQMGGWALLAIALLWFIAVWWRNGPPAWGRLAASAAVLWAAGWGVAFPALGVNRIPATLLTRTHDHAVILFDGPQPALLPMLMQRPLRQTSRLDSLPPGERQPGTLISVRKEDLPHLSAQLDALRLHSKPVTEYQALTSAGSGIRFAREGATSADWFQAWKLRSPQPLMSSIVLLELVP